MTQKIKKLILSVSSLLIVLFPLAIAGGVSAINPSDNSLNTGGFACQGTNGTISGSGASCNTGVSSFDSYVKTALNLLSIIVGIIAVIMIIVGGLRYVTSGGKQESVTGAKNTIMYALIGLVIVALAQVIVHFVLTEATNPSSSS